MTQNTSEIELLTRAYLKHTLPNQTILFNERVAWLRIFNPIHKRKTTRELDIYFPDLAFGVEVNGATHFDPGIAAVDKAKLKLCRDNGTVLYVIWTMEELQTLGSILATRFPDLVTKYPVPEKLAARMEYYANSIETKDPRIGRERYLRMVAEKRRAESAKVKKDKADRRPRQHKKHQRAQIRRDFDKIRARRGRRIVEDDV